MPWHSWNLRSAWNPANYMPAAASACSPALEIAAMAGRRLRIRAVMRPALLCLLAAVSSLHAAAPAEHVILVSIDGWSHHYFDDPRCHMPAVKALAAQGVRVRRMETSFPTVTWTNHTTLVTGVRLLSHVAVDHLSGLLEPAGQHP